MRVIHLMGANTFTDPATSTTWEAGDDGVFDLPEHVGAHYVTKHAGMFRRESDHEALLAAKKAEVLVDPRNTAPTLKALLERVKTLEDKVAAWETFFGTDAPAEAKTAETGTPETAKAAAAEPDKHPEPEPETPDDADNSDDSEDDDEDPAGNAPLRKPTPRKTAAKRRS